MSRYSKQHYEDVATILRNEFKDWSPQYQRPIPYIAIAFANLFAADNPLRCAYCNSSQGADAFLRCTDGGEQHLFTEGFNRDQFLAACGLEKG